MQAEEIFDRMKYTGVYIVDRETFVTYYENPVAQRVSVKNRIGLPCYSIHGNNYVCSSCPAKKPNHTSFVERADLGMVFIVQSEEIEWEGHPSYLITVKRHETLPQVTDSEKSMRRMSRALQQSVNVYTEINLENMQYRQINIKDAEHYTALPEGDYFAAFESMINDEIEEKDVDEVIGTMSPEVLRQIGADSNGPKELVARYHIKGDKSGRLMQSRAIFMRDELPHYVVVVVTDVTEQMIVSERRNTLEALMDNIDVGIFCFEFHGDDYKIVGANAAIMEMMGHTKEQSIGASTDGIFKYTHPDDYPVIEKVIQTMKKPNQRITYQYRTQNKNTNKYIWLEGRGHSVAQPDGTVMAYICYIDITESKEQELKLNQNHKAVELAQNAGQLSIWTYNIDRKILIQQTSEDVEGHLGYAIHIDDVPNFFIENKSIHPDDTEKFLAAYKALENGAEKSDAIYRIVDLDTNNYRWVHMYYQRIYNDTNTERIAAGFSIDIDREQEAVERYQLEQNLREQIYEDAVMYVEYNLVKNKFEGRSNLPYTYNTELWESPTEDMFRKNMSALIDDAFLDAVVEKIYAENLLKSFRNGELKVVCEYRSKQRPNLPTSWFRVTVTLAQRPDNNDIMAFIYIQNIEEEKQRQIAIESSMSDGVESIVVIHLSDGKSRIIRSKRRQIIKDEGEYFVYNDDFVDHFHKFVIEEENELSYMGAKLTTITNELAQKKIYQYSVSMKSDDGSIKRQLFRFRYLDDRRADIVMSISDITSVYHEEQEKKKQLEEALQKAQKASGAKAEFYSRMSHDMRTPMNGILGIAELSKNDKDINELKEDIEKIRESGEYLLNLVNDTLDIQRIESGKMVLEPKIVSTENIVGNVLDMMRVTAEKKGVNLKINKGNVDFSWHIRMDALRLKQIFINLLSNAVKFTPKGGTVEWKFKMISREGMISHDVIYVRDTGLGMSREFLENGIFKPFSQENNAVSTLYAGSGLGLSIAKSLVELMGGRIEVESEPGAGTTFAVYLDFLRVNKADVEKELKERKRENESISVSLQGKKILLAEDHPLNAEIAQRLLQKVGCEVKWAKNGQEVVEYFEKSPAHSFDLILMDIRMPIMDGLEAARKIRTLDKETAQSIPIIAMTANAYEEDVQTALAAGMNAHLGKPIEPQKLYETLSQYTG